MTNEEILKLAERAGLLDENGMYGPISGFSLRFGIQHLIWMVQEQTKQEVADLILKTDQWKGGKWTSSICPMTREHIANTITGKKKANK